ncbi:LysR substrate-binding domain-containing protein [Paracoccus seriniphilus]|uniref:Transcriptional regulator, LysR family n=1 Tax=Paracoccus seriniphilus TaxID=184748 RepID=A0A239PUS7_9RHOB|nr:LysR substrate-binding domain-containing protein [Paracoccus seriniphilus]WCR15391.1 LysR family transcriptional regulator [Paracoccus seriniphilus]SNT73878.1 transcriptional regulator, LysR family [Paracoccus seriniphilus]
MRRLPHVTWLRSFEAAARHSSFSAAADELNLTPAAVSQQIRLLEQHLDMQLFKRLAKGVELTDMGQAYALPIRKSFLTMQTATDGLFGKKRKSIIRVRASISFAALLLAPRLNAFRQQHPDIEIELSTTVWADRMSDASIDLDIRYGDGDWPEHNIHRLQVAAATIICHPDYAATLGDMPSAAILTAADIVQVVGSETDWDRLFEHCGFDQPRPDHWMKADSSLIALQILRAGHGCSIISRSFARQDLQSGTLVAPYPVEIPMGESFFLVERNDMGPRGDIEVFIEWLCGQHL